MAWELAVEAAPAQPAEASACVYACADRKELTGKGGDVRVTKQGRGMGAVNWLDASAVAGQALPTACTPSPPL